MESNNVKLLSNNKESQTTSPLYARFDSDLLSASQSTTTKNKKQYTYLSLEFLIFGRKSCSEIYLLTYRINLVFYELVGQALLIYKYIGVLLLL